jgi:chromosome segregation and condensation protein ScpB
MNLEQSIESILFFKAEPVSLQYLAQQLERPQEDVAEALDRLESALSGRGIRLMRDGESVLLATAPESSDLIERIRKEELSKDTGKA